MDISTRWSMTGGGAGDQISLKCEGGAPYYINQAEGIKNTGNVSVTYTNTTLQQRLLSTRPVNTSQDL